MVGRLTFTFIFIQHHNRALLATTLQIRLLGLCVSVLFWKTLKNQVHLVPSCSLETLHLAKQPHTAVCVGQDQWCHTFSWFSKETLRLALVDGANVAGFALGPVRFSLVAQQEGVRHAKAWHAARSQMLWCACDHRVRSCSLCVWSWAFLCCTSDAPGSPHALQVWPLSTWCGGCVWDTRRVPGGMPHSRTIGPLTPPHPHLREKKDFTSVLEFCCNRVEICHPPFPVSSW